MSEENIIYEPAQALSDTVSIITFLEIPYFLVGSFASGIRGEFRSTNDIDLVCKLESDKVALLIEEARQQFYCDEVSISEAIRAKKSFNLIHQNSFVKVDFFTRIAEFEEDQFHLATEIQIPGFERTVRVSTTEYNVLAKLRWYLKSNRQLELQLRDVRGMIEINREQLDHEYLKLWANKLQLNDLLREVMQDDSVTS